jgi:hypothetical protein
MASMADTTPAIVTDHPHVPPVGEPWARCVEQVTRGGRAAACKLAAAAHRVSAVQYAPDNPYRCPWCVETGAPMCVHEAAR